MDAKNVSQWGQIAVSVLALLIFAGTIIVSFFLRDTNLLLLTVGASIANGTSAVQYWLGSSSGSQKKDETIAANSTGRPPPETPPEPTIIVPPGR